MGGLFSSLFDSTEPKECSKLLKHHDGSKIVEYVKFADEESFVFFERLDSIADLPLGKDIIEQYGDLDNFRLQMDKLLCQCKEYGEYVMFRYNNKNEKWNKLELIISTHEEYRKEYASLSEDEVLVRQDWRAETGMQWYEHLETQDTFRIQALTPVSHSMDFVNLQPTYNAEDNTNFHEYCEYMYYWERANVIYTVEKDYFDRSELKLDYSTLLKRELHLYTKAKQDITKFLF